MIERGQRIYVNKGPHVGKHGKILGIMGRTALVRIDQNFQGGTYYIRTNILEKE